MGKKIGKDFWKLLDRKEFWPVNISPIDIVLRRWCRSTVKLSNSEQIDSELLFHIESFSIDQFTAIIGELIYTCKMIQPRIFSRFSQLVHFSRFKLDNLLLSTAKLSGYNLEKCTAWLTMEKNAMLDHRLIRQLCNWYVYLFVSW